MEPRIQNCVVGSASGIPIVGRVKAGKRDVPKKGESLWSGSFDFAGPFSAAAKQSLGQTDRLRITFASDRLDISCREYFYITRRDGSGGYRKYGEGDGENWMLWDGLWMFNTGGKMTSLPAIREAFDASLKMFGTVKRIPFDLVLSLAKGNSPGTARVFPVVSLVPAVSAETVPLIRQMRESGRLPAGLLTDSAVRSASLAD